MEGKALAVESSLQPLSRSGENWTYERDDIVEEVRLADRHARQTLMLDMHHVYMEVVCLVNVEFDGTRVSVQYEGW